MYVVKFHVSLKIDLLSYYREFYFYFAETLYLITIKTKFIHHVIYRYNFSIIVFIRNVDMFRY